jgi:hypothetical protein
MDDVRYFGRNRGKSGCRCDLPNWLKMIVAVWKRAACDSLCTVILLLWGIE